jgi:hypothetical protein
MAIGKSLHIGLNAVDPAAYDGWSGPLTACEADATDLFAIASAAGFSGKMLLSPAATRGAVLKELHAASAELKAGDIYLITSSSHGGQVVDRNNEEDDHMDETWCLFDGQLIDDELYEVWSRFAADVRILVLLDSCHSGTAIKVAPFAFAPPAAVAAQPSAFVAREMPRELVGRAYRAQRKLYDSLQEARPKGESDIAAQVMLISGCQDSQTSMDGPFNGAFTGALLRVWNDGAFKGSYRSFHRKIQQQLPLTQQPNLMTLGKGAGFAEQRPFTI